MVDRTLTTCGYCGRSDKSLTRTWRSGKELPKQTRIARATTSCSSPARVSMESCSELKRQTSLGMIPRLCPGTLLETASAGWLIRSRGFLMDGSATELQSDRRRPTTSCRRTRRCTRAGGNVGFEINVSRARRVNFVVRRQKAVIHGAHTDNARSMGYLQQPGGHACVDARR